MPIRGRDISKGLSLVEGPSGHQGPPVPHGGDFGAAQEAQQGAGLRPYQNFLMARATEERWERSQFWAGEEGGQGPVLGRLPSPLVLTLAFPLEARVSLPHGCSFFPQILCSPATCQVPGKPRKGADGPEGA